jgi:hypothetical protein
MRVRLIRKLAEQLNGIDLSRRRVGDIIDLPLREADLLVAEGWGRAVLEHETDAAMNTDGEFTTERHK